MCSRVNYVDPSHTSFYHCSIIREKLSLLIIIAVCLCPDVTCMVTPHPACSQSCYKTPTSCSRYYLNGWLDERLYAALRVKYRLSWKQRLTFHPLIVSSISRFLRLSHPDSALFCFIGLPDQRLSGFLLRWFGFSVLLVYSAHSMHGKDML